MDQFKISGAGVLLSTTINIDFADLRPSFYWWFFEIVSENFSQLNAPGAEREIYKALMAEMADGEVQREAGYV